jgi:xylan 1,4-beta-xylosidase
MPADFTVHTAERAGDVPPLAHAVLGDTAYNLLDAGRRLQRALEAITDRPLLRRTMSTLNTGTGLDHGSGVYREAAGGTASYDFTLLDQMLDVMVGPRSIPFFGLDFMPLELSSGTPDRLTEPWMKLDRFPPKDYQRWYDLVFNLVRHCAGRYGEAVVQTWYWDIWNEPDLEFYWLGTPEEFFHTYDTAAAAVKAALPGARVGGCGVTDRRLPLFDLFLEHCARGTNHHTGGTGAPLDFITFHVKGGETGKLGRFSDPYAATDYPVRHPSLRLVLDNIRWAMDRIAACPGLAGTPVYITECDIDWGVSTSIYHNPNLHYRSSEYFAAFQCALIAELLPLRRAYPANPIMAAFLDTFYFPGRRIFEGQRTLITGEVVDLPILNGLRLLGQLGEDQLAVTAGAGGSPALRVLATRGGPAALQVLAVNFDEAFDYAQSLDVHIALEGLSDGPWRCRHYRIDRDHSNAHTVWLALGRPVPPNDDQLAALQARMGPETCEPDFGAAGQGGRLALTTTLPPRAVSMWLLTAE